MSKNNNNAVTQRMRNSGGSAWTRAWVALALSVLLGCKPNSPDQVRWSEDVELYDGRTITLQRRSTLGSAWIPMEHRALIASWELCYEPTKTYWKSNEPYQPSGFEISNGEAYVKVPMLGCGMCAVNGNPKDSTLYFVLRQGRWQQTTAQQYPNRSWKNIMQEGIWDGRDKARDIKGHWSLDTKWTRDTITETSAYGKVVMRAHLERCSKCSPGPDGDRLALESTPTDAFCR